MAVLAAVIDQLEGVFIPEKAEVVIVEDNFNRRSVVDIGDFVKEIGQKIGKKETTRA
jgi:hypothetical protein